MEDELRKKNSSQQSLSMLCVAWHISACTFSGGTYGDEQVYANIRTDFLLESTVALAA